MMYFGYGSNLCEHDLAAYCRRSGLPPLRLAPVGIAYLPDRTLAFTHRSITRGGGVLDVPEARGRAAAGVLFRLPTHEEIATLDRKESDGHVYRRFEAVALTDDGSSHPAFAYEVVPDHREPFVAPAAAYLDVVRRGYAEHGLAAEALETAAAGGSPAGPVDGVFVYGTLRLGEERHPALVRHGVTGGEAATTAGTLLDLGSFPGLIVDGSERTVAGEMYAAPDPAALFGELDAIETFLGFGVPGSLYQRVIVRVRTAERGSMLAYTYLYAGSRHGSRVIDSGDWLRRGLSV